MTEPMTREKLTDISDKNRDRWGIVAVDSLIAEIERCWKELAAIRDLKPVAWIDRRTAGRTLIRSDPNEVAICDMNDYAASLMGCDNGVCMPLYAGTPLRPEPPSLEPLYRDDMLTIYEHAGRRCEVRRWTSERGLWWWINMMRPAEKGANYETREEAEAAAREWCLRKV